MVTNRLHAARRRVGDLSIVQRNESSCRMLDLPSAHLRFHKDPDYKARPLFNSPILNRALILKHTLHNHEREFLRLNRFVGTKIIIPISVGDLSMGGFTAFYEESNFANLIREPACKNLDDDQFGDDMARLAEIAALPSFDPYLASERLKRRGFDVSEHYFNVTNADLERMRTKIGEEVVRLVTLAFKACFEDADIHVEKLGELLFDEGNDHTLEPLRLALKLDEAEFRRSMFAWKGFLYYKMQLEDTKSQVKPMIAEMMSLDFAPSHKTKGPPLDRTKRRIAKLMYERYNQINETIMVYDAAFQAFTKSGRPGPFRTFLLQAPRVFIDTGERMACLQHIMDFWRRHFPMNAPRETLSFDAWVNLFQDFEQTLSGDLKLDALKRSDEAKIAPVVPTPEVLEFDANGREVVR